MGDPVPSSAISDATTGGLSVIVITGGSTGQVLTLQADGTYAPATVSGGSGDVVGPSSATDNAIARFDATTGKLLQNSAVTIDDSGNVAGVGTLTASGTVAVASTLKIGVEAYSAVWSVGNSFDSDGLKLVRANNSSSFWPIEVKQVGARSGLLVYDGTYYCQITTTKADFYSSPITGGSITVTGLMCAGVYTFATVPSASSNTGKFMRISDRAQKHAYSDGTNWRFFGDDAIIS